MANAVILILVIGYCLFLIYKQVQNRKAGKHLGCTGCGGSCGGCSGCDKDCPIRSQGILPLRKEKRKKWEMLETPQAPCFTALVLFW